MYLLDTNAISELDKATRGKADPNVLAWASRVHSGSLYLSVITVLELEMGVASVERRDRVQGMRLRIRLEQWVLTAFDGRILNVDIPTARRCALLHIPDRKSKFDSLIAATALVHDMTVVTRNVKDFERTGVKLINPWLPI
jgi:predicted nucleic acid-binding protein